MKRHIAYLLLALILPSAKAQDLLSDIDLLGSWVRVGESCEILSDKEIASLSTNGGGNSIRMPMVITLKSSDPRSLKVSEFSATFWNSLRCEDDFKSNDRVDFNFSEISPSCVDLSKRTGQATLRKNGDLWILADNCSKADIAWGCSSTEFTLKKVGSTLVMIPRSKFEGDCAPNSIYIYFVINPSS